MGREQSFDIAKAMLEEYLERHQLKATYTRNLVLEHLLAYEKPFDAEELYQKMSTSKGEQISRATVFTTLDLFCKCGILIRLPKSKSSSYLVAWRSQGYALLYCNSCGRITLYRQERLYGKLQSLTPPRFTTTLPVVIIYGECKACTKSRKGATEKQISRK